MDRLNSENKSKYAQRTADAGGGFFGFIKAHKVTDAIVLSGLALGVAVPSVVVPVNAQTMSTNNGNQGNDSNNNGTTTPGIPNLLVSLAVLSKRLLVIMRLARL